MFIIFLVLAVIFAVLWKKASDQSKKYQQDSIDLKNTLSAEESKNADLEAKVAALSKYQGIVDTDIEIQKKKAAADVELADAKKEAMNWRAKGKIEYDQVLGSAEQDSRAIKESAQAELDAAKQEAKDIRAQGKAAYDKSIADANFRLTATDVEAKRILDEAESKAREIAGSAYDMAGKAQEYERTITAMKNIIEGYGNRYLKPTFSLLDDLAEDFGHTEAGQHLKAARENTARLVKSGTAANCEYVEEFRRNTAIAFVLDAFNGKVDSILSKVKKDNYGTLEQKIKDAYELVNHNGKAFRNAVVSPEYLSARLEELKWAVIVQELKAKAQEEQRQIREQMREEERARREYEKAMKEAAKEEEMIRKAMEKAQKQIESANEAKRAEYEAKLEELKQKLSEAEARGQRAISMAQQTRHGNVYVISNIGSFGENVYKVGMTRRLEPMDRVRELGDASVPFPFDVHAIIESDDAPTLETTLHKALSLMQVNKVNPRKEFFRVPLADIKAMVENMGLNANWTMDAAATEYHETKAIEESMKNDPEVQRRWQEFADKIAAEPVAAADDE